VLGCLFVWLGCVVGLFEVKLRWVALCRFKVRCVGLCWVMLDWVGFVDVRLCSVVFG